MKILAVSHSCIVDVNQRLFRELQAWGHSTAIVVPTKWPHQYSRKTLHPVRLGGYNGEIIPRPVLRAGSAPLHLYLAKPTKIIDSFRPDVLYIDQEPYSLAAFQWALAASRRKLPAVFYSAQNVLKSYPFPISQTERAVWMSTNGAVVVSAEVARTLRGRGYARPINVVPLSVDLSLFRPLSRDEALARSLGLQSPVIAFIGRLVSEKGLRVLLDAFPSVRAQTGASLLVVGDGPLIATCRGRNGVVVVTGVPHSDIPRYLSVSDLLAVPSLTTPSWKEQFGRVVLEALACGVPVVGSSSGEIPHLIATAGGGVIVPEGDVSELASALRRLITDGGLRTQLGKQGRAAVTARYSSARTAGELESALQGATSGRSLTSASV